MKLTRNSIRPFGKQAIFRSFFKLNLVLRPLDFLLRTLYGPAIRQRGQIVGTQLNKI